MNRMQKHNLYHIKRNFEKKSGISIIPPGNKQATAYDGNATLHKRIPKVALMAAMLLFYLYQYSVSESGNKCDLKTADVFAFVQAYNGVVQ